MFNRFSTFRAVCSAAALLMMALPAHAVSRLPQIKHVVFSGHSGKYTVTITGDNFGVAPSGIPCTGCQPEQLQIVDTVTQPVQQVINVTAWSDTSITVTGVGVAKGDGVRVAVYNQTIGNVDAWGGTVLDLPKKTPEIDSITRTGSGEDLTLTIAGKGFGPAPEGIGDNFSSPFFVFTDYNAELPGSDGFPWNAGFCGLNDCNEVLVNISSWSDTQIVMDGFGDFYGNDWVVNPRDEFCVGIWSSKSTSDGTTGGNYRCKRAAAK